MKILIDMNLSPNWGQTLNEVGIDAVHWSAIGAPNAPDSTILEFASGNDLIILTNDLDFGAVLATANREKPSVVQVRSDDLRPTMIGKQVCQALVQMQAELQQGALLTIDPKRVRIRLLPLSRR